MGFVPADAFFCVYLLETTFAKLDAHLRMAKARTIDGPMARHRGYAIFMASPNAETTSLPRDMGLTEGETL